MVIGDIQWILNNMHPSPVYTMFPPSPLHTTVPTILIDSNMITVLELWTVGWEGEQRRECHRGPQRARGCDGRLAGGLWSMVG